MLKLWLNKIQKKVSRLRVNYIEVSVDRLIFESETNRYLMMLKSVKDEERSFIVPIQPTRIEAETNSMFFEMSRVVSFVEKLGFKFSYVRVDQNFLNSDPAEVFLKKGIFRKKLHISLIEAIYLNLGNGVPIKVNADLFLAQQQGLTEQANRRNQNFDPLFSAKVYEDEFTNNEVIM